jgi:hypothetical protein
MPYTREWNLGRKSRLVVDCTIAYKYRLRTGRLNALQRCVERRGRRLKPEAAITANDCTEHGQKLHLLEDCPCDPFRLVGADPKPQFAFGHGPDQINRAWEEHDVAFRNRRIVNEIELFLRDNLLIRQNGAPRGERQFD